MTRQESEFIMKLVLQTQFGWCSWHCEWPTLDRAKRFAPAWMIDSNGIYALFDDQDNLIESESGYRLISIEKRYLALPDVMLLTWLDSGLPSIARI
jgi:hypothetical protein